MAKRNNNPRVPIAERFWDKVDKGGEDDCWLWRAARSYQGYGKICRGGGGNGWSPASRVAWELCCGPIPPGLHVLHKCDNPPCVNPKHLFLGTRADNQDDMVAKGRNYVPPPMPGEQNPRARITAQQAAVIRSDPRSGPKIAAHYGIGTSTVYHIKNGDTWKDN